MSTPVAFSICSETLRTAAGSWLTKRGEPGRYPLPPGTYTADVDAWRRRHDPSKTSRHSRSTA
jgi:hypothetical protein